MIKNRKTEKLKILIINLIYFFSKEGREILRLQKIKRYTRATSNLFGLNFEISDSASFISQYLEIFKKEIYNFKSESNQPFIIDCGANVGVSILYFKKLYPDAQIIAFEPDKNIFSILERNVKNRNYKNVTLINKGLWNKEGKMNFIDEGADGGSILNCENEFSGKRVEIDITSLRTFLNKKVDFLKMDIEGAESIVMNDCEDLLQNVQRIFIEYHSVVNKPQCLDSILNILIKNNFRYFIESVTVKNKSPFIKLDTINNFDNLLSIYAYR